MARKKYAMKVPYRKRDDTFSTTFTHSSLTCVCVFVCLFVDVFFCFFLFFFLFFHTKYSYSVEPCQRFILKNMTEYFTNRIIDISNNKFVMLVYTEKVVNYILTHLSLASLLWDIGKQHSPRCDAAERRPIWGYSVCTEKFHRKIR